MSEITSLSFCPELARLYAAGHAIGSSGRQIDLGSASTLNNLIILRNLCLTLKPSHSLEVGLAAAGSCLAIASFYRETLAEPQCRHSVIDPFQTSYWDRIGIEAIRQAGLEDYIEVREGLSCFELPKMLETGRQFDLVYVDGSHLVEDVFIDAYFVVRLLSNEGIVAFDDCRNSHVAKVISFIRTTLEASLMEVDLSPLRADHGKSFKYRVARAVGQTQMRAFRRIGKIARKWDAPYCDF